MSLGFTGRLRSYGRRHALVAPLALAALAFHLGLVAACTSATPSGETPRPGTGKPGVPVAGAALAFDDASTLFAMPSTDVSLTLLATGGVTRATLTLEGAYEDASLTASELSLAGGATSGSFTTTLRTPSVAATFTVRASSPGVTDAVRRVSVGAQGFTSIDVTPVYAGKRAVDAFVASAFVNRSCDALAAAPLTDGVLVESAAVGSPITVAGVPAGVGVAVLVRGAHFATGCTDVAALVRSSNRAVSVNVYDLPMALTASYAATFTFASATAGADATAWRATLDDAATAAAERFGKAQAGPSDDARALLDALRDRAAPAANRAQLDAARASGQWDTKATSWLTAKAPTLHDRAVTFLTKAKTEVNGPLLATLTPSVSSKGRAVVEPQAFANLLAGSVRLVADAEFDWTADSEDTVHLAGRFTLVPSALLAASADAAAERAAPATPSVGATIAAEIDCPGLAIALVGAGVAYPQCAASCLALHCATAVASLWSDAAGASDALHVTMTASAKAQLEDTPEPKSFDGAWVGDVTASGRAYGMKGRASGAHH